MEAAWEDAGRAAALYRQAIRLDAMHVGAMSNLGALLHALGINVTEAELWCLSLHPSLPVCL